MMRVVGSIVCALLLTGCSVFGVRSGTEQVSYTVIAHLDDNTEVRRSPPQLVAETPVTAPDESSGRTKAFRVLFDYISGANRGQKTVAMTAPVETAAQAEGLYAMRFFLPADHTVETAPEPTNPEVRIVEVPERTLAVLRFSRSRGADNVARHASELERLIVGSSWRAAGEPTTLFYDSPWTIPFLRRNEV